MLYAIDVSHHQDPTALDWAGMRAAGCDACIVRLTYGTRKDKRAPEHIRLARQNGFVIGAYAFARPTERVIPQMQAFEEAADAAEYGRPEDVVPALDIEDDTAARPILPAHAPVFRDFAERLTSWKGEACYAYITQRDWGRLGKPDWVLRLPLFVAHYASPSRTEPATPNGMPWALWQHRVGPFDINGPSGYYEGAGQIDQSRVRSLRFLNGQRFDSPSLEDGALRRLPDEEDGTPDIRSLRLAELQALATEAAAQSRVDDLARLRRAARTAEGTEEELPDTKPEGHDA